MMKLARVKRIRLYLK